MPQGLGFACRRMQAIAPLALAIALALGTADAQKSAISFVQVNSATPQTAQNPVTVTYTAAQTAGDLNVVVVGWNDSMVTVSSVVDSAGNAYALAVGPTVQSGTATQSIYYAKNIKAAAASGNSVTVTFSAGPRYLDMRIAEYKGLDPSNPVDVGVAAQGRSTSSNSGSVTTTNANDVLVGANLVQSTTKAAGTGYTDRVITTPDGDILEDRVVTTTGSYSATASLSSSSAWIMQMVAFRAAGSGSGVLPSITSVNPSSGPGGMSVTVTGTNFGATQSASAVTFNGTTASPTSWSATSIVVPVPSGATTGNVVVTVDGATSNAVSFTVTTPSPSISSLSPTSGLVGTSVTIAGTSFGSTQGTSTVAFNRTAASPTSWSATSIVVPVPSGATTGNVVVTVGGAASNAVSFTVTTPSPSISSLSPTSGLVGASVTIAGTSFGSTQGTSTVVFNGTTASPTSWSATSIVVPVPSGATTGNVVVTVDGATSNGVSFTVTTSSPSISSLSPTSGLVGTSVTIAGTSFGSTQGTSTVTFNRTAASPTSWSATSIVVPVPSGATTGNVVVTVGGVASNGVSFTVTTPSPSISSLSPTSGLVGTSVTITGTSFGSTQGTSTVTFNGTTASPTNWSATSIVVPVPSGATTGNVVVTVGGASSNGVSFTVTTSSPIITSLSQSSGAVGTQITITGTNLGSSQTGSSVTFGNTAATSFASWTATSIVVSVPSGATTGNVLVTVGSLSSNGVNFTVTAPAAISFVQVNSAVPQSAQKSVKVTYAKAQTAGDLNVVVVGWNDSTATISSVVDSAGNAYSLAVGPTVQSGTATQAIYYAKSIAAAAANTDNVTVTFSTAANYADIRIAEYAGLDLSNPVDVAVAAQGTSTSSNSGSVTTTNANDLLVGANLVLSGTTAAGTGYTSRVITTPDGDILEDQVVSAIGSYSATAPLSSSSAWIMQMVAFRAAGVGAGTSPSITTLSPSSGPVGASVTVAGTNFGATQGTSTIKFNGTVATPTSWSATSIVAPVPVGTTTGNVVVTISGIASNGVNFTVTTTSPSITSLSPSSGPVGTSVTVTGMNFGATQGTSTVTFNGTAASPTSWSATSIVAPVPTGATTGNIFVTVGGVASNGVAFTVGASGPSITSVSPSLGPVGTSVTVTGTNFGGSQGSSTVAFNGTSAGVVSAWSATTIVAAVPLGATTGDVVVTVAGQASNGVPFTVAPDITSLSQTSGAVGTQITITGTNFGSSQAGNSVTFDGTAATTFSSWSATSIGVTVPAGAATGNVVVTTDSLSSNGVSFTVSSGVLPTLIQSASCPNSQGSFNPISTTPDYYCPLPEPATGGNTILVGFIANNENIPNFTVTDDESDSFTIPSSCTGTDSNGNEFFLAYLIGVTAGARVIDIHATALGTGYWAPQVAEFSNISSFDKCVVNAQSAYSTSITAGSVTPSASGELLGQWAFVGDANLGNGPIPNFFTVSSQSNITWQFSDQSEYDAQAMQYGVYNSTSAINPTFTAEQADTWDSVAAFFTPGTSGGLPSQAFRIDHVLHLNVMGGQGYTTLEAGFPSSGNEIILSSFWGQGTCITGVSSNPSNTWTNTGPCYNGGSATTYDSRWYCSPCNTANNMTLTITLSTAGDGTILVYDVLNAASSSSFDKSSGGQVGNASNHLTSLTTCSNCIAPSGAGEIVFSEGGWDNCTASGASAPAGVLFDAAYFTGNSYDGPQTVDQNNQASHYYTSGSTPLTYSWNMLCASSQGPGSWSDLEDAFK